jgi:hypothetical protein
MAWSPGTGEAVGSAQRLYVRGQRYAIELVAETQSGFL